MRANLLMFVACLFCFSLMTASGQTYLQFEGLEGESQDNGHVGWIDISSFEQSHKATKPENTGGIALGGFSTRPVFDDIMITSRIDKASPKIAEAVANGRNFPTVRMDVTATIGGDPGTTYLTYELTNVQVTSYSLTVGTEVTNTFALCFEAIRVIYTQYAESGLGGGTETTVEYMWNTQEGAED